MQADDEVVNEVIQDDGLKQNVENAMEDAVSHSVDDR